MRKKIEQSFSFQSYLQIRVKKGVFFSEKRCALLVWIVNNWKEEKRQTTDKEKFNIFFISLWNVFNFLFIMLSN